MFKQSPSDRQETMLLFRLMDSIKNGIPLDDVKAEIKEYKHGNGNMFACGLAKAIEIVDKHIEGDKE